MNLSFLRRITNSGNVITEIDGLRFLAIAMVVFFHLDGFLFSELRFDYKDDKESYGWLHEFFLRGYFGVEIFFVISAFILALPFAKYYLGEGKKVSIGSYFYRRLTRLEPPYIISLLLIVWFQVSVLEKKTFEEFCPSFYYSLFYGHNFFHTRDVQPLVNNVTWSLEIEIQFYILAPILFYIFFKKFTNRKVMLILITLFFSILTKFIKPDFFSLYEYFHFFSLGILVALCYAEKIKISFIDEWNTHWRPDLVTLVAFLLMMITDITYLNDIHPFTKILLSTAQLFFLFVLFYNVLMQEGYKFVFSNINISVMGGMCYSIYLLHNQITMGLGSELTRRNYFNYFILDYCWLGLLLFIYILMISFIFYLVLERPCMDKNWPVKLWKFIQTPFLRLKPSGSPE
ncbi:MAG: acyltransferase [Saprospiraceae bacterium]|nr:acyltransferase [Candidatus Vicinibacter proximus]